MGEGLIGPRKQKNWPRKKRIGEASFTGGRKYALRELIARGTYALAGGRGCRVCVHGWCSSRDMDTMDGHGRPGDFLQKINSFFSKKNINSFHRFIDDLLIKMSDTSDFINKL